MSNRTVSEFRDQLMQTHVSIGTDGDPFTQAYVNEVNEITAMMLSVTEEADIGKFDRLIVHWLDWFGEKAYQDLARSLATGYSHVSAMMEQQAVAVAEHEAFKALKSWRDYGIFEIAKTVTRP